MARVVWHGAGHWLSAPQPAACPPIPHSLPPSRPHAQLLGAPLKRARTRHGRLGVLSADAHNFHLVARAHDALLHAPRHHRAAALQAGRQAGGRRAGGWVSEQARHPERDAMPASRHPRHPRTGIQPISKHSPATKRSSQPCHHRPGLRLRLRAPGLRTRLPRAWRRACPARVPGPGCTGQPPPSASAQLPWWHDGRVGGRGAVQGRERVVSGRAGAGAEGVAAREMAQVCRAWRVHG